MVLPIIVTASTAAAVLLVWLVAGNAIARARRWKQKAQSHARGETEATSDKK